MASLCNNELQILLSLNGNRRLPHLEEEIFADSGLTMLYLNTMHTDEVKYDCPASMAAFIRYYASYVMCNRWKNAEPVIMKDDWQWRRYKEEWSFT